MPTEALLALGMLKLASLILPMRVDGLYRIEWFRTQKSIGSDSKVGRRSVATLCETVLCKPQAQAG